MKKLNMLSFYYPPAGCTIVPIINSVGNFTVSYKYNTKRKIINVMVTEILK